MRDRTTFGAVQSVLSACIALADHLAPLCPQRANPIGSSKVHPCLDSRPGRTECAHRACAALGFTPQLACHGCRLGVAAESAGARIEPVPLDESVKAMPARDARDTRALTEGEAASG